jgi:hypothetical protein
MGSISVMLASKKFWQVYKLDVALQGSWQSAKLINAVARLISSISRSFLSLWAFSSTKSEES